LRAPAAGTRWDAYWNAIVKHDRLGSVPTYVNGGLLRDDDPRPGQQGRCGRRDLHHHGGKITTLDPGANCTNQKYQVVDTQKSVSTPTTSNGSGNFTVTLTHYRHASSPV
jgi:hypothetical protein